MNTDMRKLLEDIRNGSVPIEDALLKLKTKPFEDIGYTKVDMHRKLRQGTAEVIYGTGKTPEQITGIVGIMLENGQTTILITRLSQEAAAQVEKSYPLNYHKDACCGIIGQLPIPDGIGKIVVVTGGTSDIPVAQEAALTATVWK